MSERTTVRREWGLALGAAVALGLASLAPAPTASDLLGSGTVWAGLLVLAGWLVRRPRHAAAAGVVVALTAMGVHDGAGQLLGAFGADAWSGDRWWFATALVAGPPLGLLGAAARRADRRGSSPAWSCPPARCWSPSPPGRPARR